MARAKAKLEKSLGGDTFPLDYSTSMRVIRDALAAVSPAPVVVSEGANTMDNARYLSLSPRPLPLSPPLLLPLQHWLCFWTMLGILSPLHDCRIVTAPKSLVLHTQLLDGCNTQADIGASSRG